MEVKFILYSPPSLGIISNGKLYNQKPILKPSYNSTLTFDLRPCPSISSPYAMMLMNHSFSYMSDCTFIVKRWRGGEYKRMIGLYVCVCIETRMADQWPREVSGSWRLTVNDPSHSCKETSIQRQASNLRRRKLAIVFGFKMSYGRQRVKGKYQCVFLVKRRCGSANLICKVHYFWVQ